MLLQILRTFEALSAEVALVRLQWNMNTNVRRDVIALDRGGPAHIPPTGQIQVVGALAPYMALAYMVIECLGRFTALRALVPLAGKVIIAG